MKLSEVSRAHGLVGDRRKLVSAFVEIGGIDIDRGNYGGVASCRKVFGYPVDDEMTDALRKAARQEIRRRIDLVDAELAQIGVEVDGIEIAIASEEALQNRKEASVERC